MGTERSTVFLHDPKTDELWSLVATGMKKNEIRIPSQFGAAGWVFHHEAPLLINDAYEDPHFFPDVDKLSGFHTRNILCVPLTTRDKRCIGALQTLNKYSGSFSDNDVHLLTSIAPYVTIALENARLYEQLKTLDKAKERVINHLSHELKTPLAILTGVLDRLERKLRESQLAGLRDTIGVGQRNLQRLLQLQSKIDDILQGRSETEKFLAIHLVEDVLSLVHELDDELPREQDARILDLVKQRLNALYHVDQTEEESIPLSPFLHDICDEALADGPTRMIDLIRDFENDLILYADRKVLHKVCSGLLKNAIENTPDEGRIEITTRTTKTHTQIDFQDYGVGITEENQQLILGGFFHTQDTLNYSTKQPYDFNAGGSGSDLLRIKVLSERCGFTIQFNRTRCVHAPTDLDSWAGRISSCRKVKSPEECYASGGTLFTVRFPQT